MNGSTYLYCVHQGLITLFISQSMGLFCASLCLRFNEGQIYETNGGMTLISGCKMYDQGIGKH